MVLYSPHPGRVCQGRPGRSGDHLQGQQACSRPLPHQTHWAALSTGRTVQGVQCKYSFSRLIVLALASVAYGIMFPIHVLLDVCPACMCNVPLVPFSQYVLIARLHHTLCTSQRLDSPSPYRVLKRHLSSVAERVSGSMLTMSLTEVMLLSSQSGTMLEM